MKIGLALEGLMESYMFLATITQNCVEEFDELWYANCGWKILVIIFITVHYREMEALWVRSYECKVVLTFFLFFPPRPCLCCFSAQQDAWRSTYSPESHMMLGPSTIINCNTDALQNHWVRPSPLWGKEDAMLEPLWLHVVAWLSETCESDA